LELILKIEIPEVTNFARLLFTSSFTSRLSNKMSGNDDACTYAKSINEMMSGVFANATAAATAAADADATAATAAADAAATAATATATAKGADNSLATAADVAFAYVAFAAAASAAVTYHRATKRVYHMRRKVAAEAKYTLEQTRKFQKHVHLVHSTEIIHRAANRVLSNAARRDGNARRQVVTAHAASKTAKRRRQTYHHGLVLISAPAY
jgi:hypothetical protein